MKKHIMIFILLFSLTIGFAALTTVLDIKGNVNVAENLEDFRIEINNLKINDEEQVSLISNDKQSFTFTGSGNDNISYTVTNYSYQYDANINLVCTPNDQITVEQIGNLPAQKGIIKSLDSKNANKITCTINVEKISRTEYAKDVCKIPIGQTWEFNYIGAEQEFVSPCDGNYKIELWGASGTLSNLNSVIKTGGSYTKGNLKLLHDKKLYVYVGVGAVSYDRTNTDYTKLTFAGTPNGFNGGGKGSRQCGDGSYYGGIMVSAGATDIRTINGSWNNLSSLTSRIMVAAASGGTSYNSNGTSSIGGPGGGLNGYSGTRLSYGTGATQTSGGSLNGTFGSGGNANWTATACNTDDAAGGSGGWYGGGGATATGSGTFSSGGSGSSYISGHNGCIGVISNGSTTPKCSSTNVNLECSKSWTNYVFTDTVMVDGAGYKWTNVKGAQTGMPTHDGKSTMTGNLGNGYAKITYLGE